MVSYQQISLPLSLYGRADINRLLREIAKIDEFFLAAKARQSGDNIQPPRVTRVLSALAKDNQLNLLQADDRKFLKDQLEAILKRAPDLHISFASDPTPRALEKIVSWLRQNIHPEALVVVGLQPGIAAGMVLRTPNRIFDMSLQAYLKQQEGYLAKLIGEAAR
ncbi:MAG TPA: hypothetical protein VFT49_00015 [Candidatus Saccharimonadales bacterium]|nr:hypothetical protein [Candidatus Saccharimonadales bacterium]